MQQLPEIIEILPDVRLEKIAQQHASAMFAQIDRHRDYLANYVDWTRFNTQLVDSQNFVKKCQEEIERGETFTWAICVKGKAAGTISFNKPIDWQARTALIGYWLSPDAQGKGIVTQSVNALIAATENHFSHYILRCAVHNQRSNQVAQRCGFAFVERVENAEKIGDKLYAQNVYRRSV